MRTLTGCFLLLLTSCSADTSSLGGDGPDTEPPRAGSESIDSDNPNPSDNDGTDLLVGGGTGGVNLSPSGAGTIANNIAGSGGIGSNNTVDTGSSTTAGMGNSGGSGGSNSAQQTTQQPSGGAGSPSGHQPTDNNPAGNTEPPVSSVDTGDSVTIECSSDHECDGWHVCVRKADGGTVCVQTDDPNEPHRGNGLIPCPDGTLPIGQGTPQMAGCAFDQNSYGGSGGNLGSDDYNPNCDSDHVCDVFHACVKDNDGSSHCEATAQDIHAPCPIGTVYEGTPYPPNLGCFPSWALCAEDEDVVYLAPASPSCCKKGTTCESNWVNPLVVNGCVLDSRIQKTDDGTLYQYSDDHTAVAIYGGVTDDCNLITSWVLPVATEIACDGPEDCTNGYTCRTFTADVNGGLTSKSSGSFCSGGPNGKFNVLRCHESSDCLNASACQNGYCL